MDSSIELFKTFWKNTQEKRLNNMILIARLYSTYIFVFFTFLPTPRFVIFLWKRLVGTPVCSFLEAGTVYFHFLLKRDVAQQDEDVITPADYSVHVDALPTHVR